MHGNFDFVYGDIVEKSVILNECTECFRLVIEAKHTVFPIGPEASEVSGCLLQFSKMKSGNKQKTQANVTSISVSLTLC